MKNQPDIQQLFPEGVVTACCRIEDREAFLYPEERSAVARAIDKRKREFSTGRFCARRALEKLGLQPCCLPQRPDRSARWPEGIIGSLSHNRTWCGAVVARNDIMLGVGLDIETISRVSVNIQDKILTDNEIAWIAALSEDHRQRYRALIFSAKEAVYKCIYPAYRFRMGFHDAQVYPDRHTDTFVIEIVDEEFSRPFAGKLLSGRYLIYDDSIFSGITLPA